MTMNAASTPVSDDLPNRTHPRHEAMAPRWRRCRDLAGGTDVIQAAGPLYLPKHPMEDSANYKIRATSTEVFNAFARTIAAMAGLVMQCDPELSEGASEDVKKAWTNIDGAGTAGPVFAKRLFGDALTVGMAGILVDYPPTPPGLSHYDEQQAGARAYWLHIRAEDVRSWRVGRQGGQLVFTKLVIRERVERPAGRFGTRIVTQYREFWRNVTTRIDPILGEVEEVEDVVRWQLWRHPDGDESKAAEPVGAAREIRNQKKIPFSPLVVGNDAGLWDCAPPLLDLADVNLAHYRVNADRRYVMHIACVPIPTIIGDTKAEDEPEKVISPNVAFYLPRDADFKYVSPDGVAFEPTGKDLERLEDRMADLGMAFLSGQKRSAETAKAKQIDSTAQNATLSGAAGALQDCLNNALAFHVAYSHRPESAADADAQAPTATVNREFEQTVLDPAAMDSYARMQTAGQLSLPTFWALLEKGHRLPEDFDAKAEQARIHAEGAEAVQKATELVAAAGGDVPPAGGAKKKGAAKKKAAPPARSTRKSRTSPTPTGATP